MRRMRRFAYADPPYLGCAVRYYSDHPQAGVYDTVDGHAALIGRLEEEFDGWALSCNPGNLRELLPLCPSDVILGSWVKPFAGRRPGVRIGYAWEPVIVKTSAAWDYGPQARTWLMANSPMHKDGGPRFVGRKPAAFAAWIADLVGWKPGDDLIDLFHGSGAVAAEFSKLREPEFQLRLNGEAA
jgi:hypothetical protein